MYLQQCRGSGPARAVREPSVCRQSPICKACWRTSRLADRSRAGNCTAHAWYAWHVQGRACLDPCVLPAVFAALQLRLQHHLGCCGPECSTSTSSPAGWGSADDLSTQAAHALAGTPGLSRSLTLVMFGMLGCILGPWCTWCCRTPRPRACVLQDMQQQWTCTSGQGGAPACP